MSQVDEDIIDSQIAIEDVRHSNTSLISPFPDTLKVVKKYATEDAKIQANTSLRHKTLDWSISSKTTQEGLLPWNLKVPNKELKACLPLEIARKYAEKGITEMFEWQVSCLQNPKVLLECANLVYSAPTSAGKTLVAEILAIKTVLERKMKVIIILPYELKVKEKVFYLQDILSSSGKRVEGFMGSQSPPGGLQSVHVAVCTIETANSLVNRLLDEGTISDLGAVVVDELHLLGDPHRGYLLELLLTKVKYVTQTREDVKIQIIGMSTTLPNLQFLAKWLDAELYITWFRPIPLDEYCLVGQKLFNKDGVQVSVMEDAASKLWAKDNVLKICFDTIKYGGTVLIFCMTKSRCESLAQNIASSFLKLGCAGNEIANILKEQLNAKSIFKVLKQLKNCPVGLDSVLKKVISFGVAYHHAGLTFEERDIIERAFKSGVIRVLVATSTLSSGVNLQARVVIIKDVVLNENPMNIFTYKQIIGRAGRMGKETKGESILICTKAEKKIGLNLMMGTLRAVTSSIENEDKFLRPILEMVASEVACTHNNLMKYAECTLLFYQKVKAGNVVIPSELISKILKELQSFGLIKSQDVYGDIIFVATSLGKACLASSVTPHDGLIIFCELQKARLWHVLKTELFLLYLVTPYSVSNQWVNIDWLHMLNISRSLTKSMKKLGRLLGIQNRHIMRFVKMPLVVDNSKNPINIHKRFFVALALQDLVNEVPLTIVAAKFRCTRGFLQSLQQSAASFAGMVTAFCQQLEYKNIEVLISQFQDRLRFGIRSELLDLIQLPSLSGLKARSLFNAGFETVTSVAAAEEYQIKNALFKAVPFQSKKDMEKDNDLLSRTKNNNASNVFNCKGNKEIEINGTKMGVSEEIGSIKNEFEVKEMETETVNFYEGKIEVEEHDVTSIQQENLLENNSDPGQVISQSVKKTHQKCNVESLIDLIIKNELTKTDNTISNENHVRDCICDTDTTAGDINRNDHILPQIETNIEHTVKNSLLPENLSIFDDNLPVELKVFLLSDIEDDEQTPDGKENDFSLVHNTDHNALSHVEEDQAPDADEDNCTLTYDDDHDTGEIENIELIRQESTESNAVVTTESKAFTITDNNDKNTKLRKRSLNYKQKGKPRKCNKRPRLNKASKSNTQKIKINHSRQQNNKNIFLNNFMRFMRGGGTDNEFDEASSSSITKKIENIDITYCVFKGDTVLPKLDDLFEIDCAAIYFDFKQPEVLELEEIIDQNIVNNTADMSSSNYFNIGDINYLAICSSKEIVYAFDLSPFAKTSPVSAKLEEWFRRRTLHLIVLSSNKTTTAIRKYFGVEMLASCYDICLCEWLLTQNNLLNLGPPKSITDGIEATCFKAKTIWLTAIKQRMNLHAYRIMQRVLADDNQVSLILTRSKWYGLTVDLTHASDLLIAVENALEEITNTAHRIATRSFNLHSSQGVIKVLRGARSFTEDNGLKLHCSALSNAIMYGKKLEALRAISCLLIKETNFNDDKIYPTYSMLTSTGRMNMSGLNLQSMPRTFSIPRSYLLKGYKGEDVVEFNCRNVFEASPGYVLVSADYSQLEMRILTFLSKDPNLTEIMKSDEDVFTMIAARWNNMKSDDVDDNLRDRAKQLCYGMVYDMGQKTSEMLDITSTEARYMGDSFYSKYPGVRSFMNSVSEECLKTGYVETLLERRRYLPGIKDKDATLKHQAVRQAIRFKVQGSAADIVKAAMCEVDNRTRNLDDSCRPRLVLQMHDELIYEVPEPFKHNFITTLRYAMEINTLQCVKSKIYLPFKIKSGLTYGSLKEL